MPPLLRRYRATLGLGALLGLLMAQFVFAYTVTEPYPALILPGFSNIPSTGEKVQTTDVELHFVSRSDSTYEVSTQELFATVPPVHDFILARRLFTRQSILERAPGGMASSLPMPRQHRHRTADELTTQVRQYACRRARALGLPSRSLKHLRITWLTCQRSATTPRTCTDDFSYTLDLRTCPSSTPSNATSGG